MNDTINVIDAREHLEHETPAGRNKYHATKATEAYCTACTSRVSVDPNDGTEYGHSYACPCRPSDLPQSVASGREQETVENARAD